MYKMLICSVDELWLKGRNRSIYMRTLLKHIDRVLRTYHGRNFFVKNDSQRLTYSSDQLFSHETLLALLKIPGLAGIYPSFETALDLEELKKSAALEMAQELALHSGETPVTFKVVCKRINRSFPIPSMELERELGAHLLRNFPRLKVDVKKPEIKIDVRVVENRILVALRFYRGVGGLPVGTAGHGVVLLSGGFDSPVASFLLAKRGLRQTFVFFHAHPFVGNEVLEKIKSLTTVLGKYHKQCHLYIVPFGNIQRKISEVCREEYRTILFRQEMVKISEMLAREIKGDCLVTGDALAQVSSQTLANMHLMNKATDMMILRPLIGFNKLEVLKIATEIKTHDISLIPHDDACALFAPDNPIINPDQSYWEKLNGEFDWQDERKTALKGATVYNVHCNGELILEDNRLFTSD